MFDSLREQSNSDASADGETAFGGDQTLDVSPAPPRGGGVFLGMTAPQRLIIAVLLLLSVCVLGTMCLMITGRIGLG